MNAALKVRSWCDDYQELYDSIELSYQTAHYFMLDPKVAEHVDAIVDNLLCPTQVPYSWEELQSDYYCLLDETVYELVAMLEKNDEEVIKRLRGCANPDEHSECIGELADDIFDCMSYSGQCDRTELLLLSCVLRGICCRLTNNDSECMFSGDLTIPKNIEFSIGDAQNVLFPQFIKPINDELCDAIGLMQTTLDEPIDLRLVAIRRPGKEALQIEGSRD